MLFLEPLVSSLASVFKLNWFNEHAAWYLPRGMLVLLASEQSAPETVSEQTIHRSYMIIDWHVHMIYGVIVLCLRIGVQRTVYDICSWIKQNHVITSLD